MKVLSDILSAIAVLEIIGDTEVSLSGLTLDSREVKPNYLFAATRGAATDGHRYIAKAIEQGAGVIVCEDLPTDTSNATYVVVENSANALGYLASEYYDNPSSNLQLVGVTGTNGKTSIATMLYQCFMNLGHKCGLLSTIKYSIGGEDYKSTHTTPNSVRINELLAEMVNAGCMYAFMEVSSHALHQGRTAGLAFNGAIFSNITHDHLDYHTDFKEYLYTKKRLFDGLSSDAFAITNKDDRNGKVMVQNTKASVYTYSLKSVSDFKTKIIESDFDGMLLSIRNSEVWLRLVGKFNAYNVLAVYSTAFLLGKEHLDIVTALSAINSVDGRFQHIKEAGITAIVDYAHTPDALQNVVDTINAIRTTNEQLITVVGCGGDRDTEKRPVMARIACEASTRVILTSDNPRSEDPNQIIKEMMVGVEPQHFKKVLQISNREEAIKTAISLSNAGDVILVAGKGHETYQEINGVKYPFDDKEIITKNLKLIKE
ncbi:MAG: UDP-N-acetylmuramoyl-L-alanyl-D-glutamate--2,6-diaminopimelate ligase [Bacteroidetes bacterium]|jgi:UDP-N-acetylmuramoyl-L-alanyl-D-glutamate--2,6-diaminopimelate ligase|nr:UDP-N-acetylmuramoyl-L-alanyl-D-glutamate--2,6-diaminopimelate ligase [Bacteroidota bacterium]